jgi:hypothetical protein
VLFNRWYDVLDPNIDRSNARTGKWGGDEDSKLKDAVQRHGDKDWVAVAALVPGRTNKDLNPSIALTAGRAGIIWTADELITLKDALERHGGKNWAAIAALVTGRTEKQCRNRWHDALDPSID